MQDYPPVGKPFLSAHRRSIIVIGFLAGGALISLCSLMVSLAQTLLPTTDIDRLEDNPFGGLLVLLWAILLLIQFATFMVTAVLFLFWLYRAYENLPALGTPRSRLEYSSAWAVGSFFVPFVSLVVPYRAVRELWRKSAPQVDVTGFQSYETSPPAFFGWWWFFWIAGNIGNNIVFKVGMGREDGLPLPWLYALVDGIEILSAICMIMVIRSIDQRQEETKRRVISQAPVGPPPPPQFQY
jgi:hypothetical protein